MCTCEGADCTCVQCVCVCVGDRSQSGESESSLAHAAPGLSVPCSSLPGSFLSSSHSFISFSSHPFPSEASDKVSLPSLSTTGARDVHAAPGSLVGALRVRDGITASHGGLDQMATAPPSPTPLKKKKKKYLHCTSFKRGRV